MVEGNYQITISREKQVIGCAGSINVELNGAIIGKLKIGKSITVTIPGGQNIVSFLIAGKRKDVRVDASGKTPVIYLSAKLNTRGDIEVTRRESNNNLDLNYLEFPRKKKKHPLLKGIGVAFLIVIALSVIFGESDGDNEEKLSSPNEEKNSASSVADEPEPQADTWRLMLIYSLNMASIWVERMLSQLLQLKTWEAILRR